MLLLPICFFSSSGGLVKMSDTCKEMSLNHCRGAGKLTKKLFTAVLTKLYPNSWHNSLSCFSFWWLMFFLYHMQLRGFLTPLSSSVFQLIYSQAHLIRPIKNAVQNATWWVNRFESWICQLNEFQFDYSEKHCRWTGTALLSKSCRWIPDGPIIILRLGFHLL